jgi:hypothetical protein
MQYLNGGTVREEQIHISKDNVLAQVELWLRTLGKVKNQDDILHYDIKQQADGNFIVSMKIKEERSVETIDFRKNGKS